MLVYFCPLSYSVWNNNSNCFAIENEVIETGNFSITFEYHCTVANLKIDDVFKQNYMAFKSGVWDWKRDLYGNIVNASQIKSLTPKDTIIKNDICYLVKTNNFNLIDHGIPQKDFPVGWALVPLGKHYVLGWTYLQNHIVQTTDGQYFMAKWYTTTNPLTDRGDWNKIEPTIPNDFYPLLNTMMADYSNPKLEKIKRSYVWDEFTNYLVGDVVCFNQNEYECVKDNCGVLPANNLWAWVNNG